MYKIMLCGVMVEDNFGSPSVMQGLNALLKRIFGNGYVLICYQKTVPRKSAVRDIPYSVKQIPYKDSFSIFIDYLKLLLGQKLKSKEKDRFFKDIQTSDLVINLVGIYFYGNAISNKYIYIRAIKSTLKMFIISYIAKRFNVKSIKSPASYGPITNKKYAVSARFASKYIFDTIFAREPESERQMREEAGVKKKIFIAPDLGNLMPYEKGTTEANKPIGIAVSHKIIRHWNSKEPYISCIVKLARHIHQNYEGQIVLIPNEYTYLTPYNDINVATDIYNQAGCPDYMSILDAKNISSLELKNIISNCETLISSRYHSCVASLSSGVPTIVLGWHHKYNGLLELYGQSKWLLTSIDCTAERLISMFDELWKVRKDQKLIIQHNFKKVEEQLIEAGNIMFDQHQVGVN